MYLKKKDGGKKCNKERSLIKLNTYDFYSKDAQTQKGTKDIVDYFSNWYFIIDVQDEEEYQKKDIDLIVLDKQDIHDVHTVEIKCDSYGKKSSNYFAETISNKNKNTLGCWLITESDYIAYYFPDLRELHMIKTKSAQEWTKEHLEELPKRQLSTGDGHGNVYYKSEGVLINRQVLIDAIGISILKI